jgi:hypothetical protein
LSINLPCEPPQPEDRRPRSPTCSRLARRDTSAVTTSLAMSPQSRSRRGIHRLAAVPMRSKHKTPKPVSLKIRKRRSTRPLSSRGRALLKGTSQPNKHRSQALSLSRRTNSRISSSKKTVAWLPAASRAPPPKEMSQGSTRRT